ncbi:unnamed protein product [Absidia cylindrospora]
MLLSRYILTCGTQHRFFPKRITLAFAIRVNAKWKILSHRCSLRSKASGSCSLAGRAGGQDRHSAAPTTTPTKRHAPHTLQLQISNKSKEDRSYHGRKLAKFHNIGIDEMYYRASPYDLHFISKIKLTGRRQSTGSRNSGTIIIIIKNNSSSKKKEYITP